MSWQLASFAVLALALAAGFGWYERGRPDARVRGAGRDARRARRARPDRVRRAAERQADDRHRPDRRLRARRRTRVRGRRDRRADVELLLRPGAVDAVADGGLGRDRRRSAAGARRASRRAADRPVAAGARLRGRAAMRSPRSRTSGTGSTSPITASRQLGGVRRPGIGFDLVHAAGCLAFALAFGPALIGVDLALHRPAARSAGCRRGVSCVLALAGVARARCCGGRGVAGQRPAPAPDGYLLAAQNGDGGFGAAPGSASDPLFSGWAALGLAAAGDNPADVQPRRNTPARLPRARAPTAAATSARSSGRCSSPAPPGARRATSAAGISSATLERHIRADGSVGDRSTSRRSRSWRCARPQRPVPARIARLAGPPAGRRRRLQLRHGAAAPATSTTPARRSRRSAPGRPASAPRGPLHRAPSRTATAASRPSPGATPTPSRPRGRPGADRGRGRSGTRPLRRPLAARLPALADRPRRPRPLRPRQRSDAGVGHRPRR